MRLKPKTLLFAAFGVFMYAVFMFFIFSTGVLWVSVGLGALATAAITAELYYHYHYKHANAKEKHRIQAQKPMRRYFFDRWYTPADSTTQNHLTEELLERKKKIRRK
jgi:hypothetical protein